ncbi:hypothetical protein TREES_T100019482 [Tupaia chinensis]|uniref:Uncharacterized protein n=1 Tax=Tupaia chinensis TaxID=246437 RepID=L9KHY2_TUPCH|nr:hypothetical protein TREES_T100019482 [Tupaia chinensis]
MIIPVISQPKPLRRLPSALKIGPYANTRGCSFAQMGLFTKGNIWHHLKSESPRELGTAERHSKDLLLYKQNWKSEKFLSIEQQTGLSVPLSCPIQKTVSSPSVHSTVFADKPQSTEELMNGHTGCKCACVGEDERGKGGISNDLMPIGPERKFSRLLKDKR